MKNFKKVIALSSAATMLISSVAIATDGVGGGSSSVENNNAVTTPYVNVTLPTLSNTSYDFTIDTEGLLATYNPTDYVSGQSVYFQTTKTVAQYKAKADGAKFYTKQKAVDSAFLTNLVGKTVADFVDGKGFYVWTPAVDGDGAPTGKGEWTALTSGNLANYVTYEVDEASKVKADPSLKAGNSGANIFDGKVYFEDYVIVQDAVIDAAKYDLTDLYISADATQYAQADTTASTGNCTLEAATSQYTGTTDKAIVKNNSTKPIAVKVNVSLTNTTGLTFTNDDTFAADDVKDKASLYFEVNDTTVNNKVTVSSSDSSTGATAYYVIDGASIGSTTYQMSTKDDLTGSHNYASYEDPNPVYKEQGFQIVAKANTASTADAAWSAYVESLKDSTNTKPSISVVYTFAELTADADVATNFKYTDNEGNTYTATATSGWATYADATPVAPVDPTDGYVEWDGTYDNNAGAYWLGNENSEAFGSSASVTSVTVNTKSVNYTLDSDGWLIVEWADITDVGEDDASSWTFEYVVDGVTYTATGE